MIKIYLVFTSLPKTSIYTVLKLKVASASDLNWLSSATCLTNILFSYSNTAHSSTATFSDSWHQRFFTLSSLLREWMWFNFASNWRRSLTSSSWFWVFYQNSSSSFKRKAFSLVFSRSRSSIFLISCWLLSFKALSFSSSLITYCSNSFYFQSSSYYYTWVSWVITA